MFEKERAEIRILSNIADAQGLSRARDLLRLAEAEFADRSRHHDELRKLAAAPPSLDMGVTFIGPLGLPG